MLANFSNLITFSRGSNATVTDASGRLTYAPNNLLTNSQDFEAAAWTKINGGAGSAPVVTANAGVAPDGSTTADRLQTNAGGTAAADYSVLRQVSSTIAGMRSIWMRSNTGSNQTVYFGNPVNNLAAVITPTWQRFSVLGVTANSNFDIGSYPNAAAGTQSCDILIWGAQFEQVTYQITPSPYVSTSVANLLGFSEDFTNAAWTKQRASIVPNAAQNPINGLWTAQKLMEDTTASNSHRVSSALITMPSGILSTVSVYMKAAERTWGYITDAGVTNSGAYVNLATGEFGTIAGGVTRSSIQSVGNGWYRVSISGYLAGTLSQLFVSVATSNGNFSYTGDGNSGIYIYGAQLSNSGSLDPYVPTPGAAPSSTAYYGPRFDYDPVTLAPKGLLIEEQRANLLVYSNTFSPLPWSGANTNLTPASTSSPEGAVNAWKMSAANGLISAGLRQPITKAASPITYTATIFAKAAGYNFLQMAFFDGTNGNRYWFNLATGAVGTNSLIGAGLTGVSASISSVGNGWYRCSVTATSGTPTSLETYFYPSETNGANGTGNANNDGVFIYGAQLEAGAFATSYIPTVASTVTRSADVAAITGSLFSQWYRQDEGAFVAKFTPMVITSDRGVLSANDGSGSNDVDIRASSSPSSVVATGGVSQAVLTVSGAAVGVSSRLALSYAANDFGLVRDGGTAAKDTTGAVPTVTQMQLGNLIGSTAYALNGYIRSIQYIPNRISDTQLQSLTAS